MENFPVIEYFCTLSLIQCPFLNLLRVIGCLVGNGWQGGKGVGWGGAGGGGLANSSWCRQCSRQLAEQPRPATHSLPLEKDFFWFGRGNKEYGIS